jgi:hypothetical protein
MPRPRASVRFSPPSMRSSCEPSRNGRRPPVHAPQKTPKETLVVPAPHLLLTTYKGSRKVGLNLTGLLIKLSEVARRTSGSVGSSTHECCEHLYACKFLPILRGTAYGSHGRVEQRRTNNSSITAPTSSAGARVANRSARYRNTLGSLPVGAGITPFAQASCTMDDLSSPWKVTKRKEE